MTREQLMDVAAANVAPWVEVYDVQEGTWQRGQIHSASADADADEPFGVVVWVEDGRLLQAPAPWVRLAD